MVQSFGRGQLSVPANQPLSWKPLRVGAGGFLRSMDLATIDNTMVAQADTYGSWLWDGARASPNGSTGMWVQLCSPDRFPWNDIASQTPDGQDSFTGQGGVYTIRIAPSDTNIFYQVFLGMLYKTTNRGALWAACTFTRGSGTDFPPNAGAAQYGPRMAIDPINPNRVIFGAASGALYRTTDGGATVSTISTGQVPACTSTGYSIVYDPRVSTQSGGSSQVVYAVSYGNGVYKSSDGGATWAAQNGTGMPTTARDAVVNPTNGDLYVCDDSGGLNNLWKLSGSTWTHTTATGQGSGLTTIAIDPSNNSNMIAFQQAASNTYCTRSTDGGATWDNGTSTYTLSSPSGDIPWLALKHGPNVGRAVFDSTGKLFAADGVGIWTGTPSSSFTLTSQSRGIEQLITNRIIAPPGGYPVVASWDRAFFTITNPKQYPSSYYPAAAQSNEIVPGWDVDYATADPTFIMGYPTGMKPVKSTDKGLTWAETTTEPAERNGGMIAVSSSTNALIATNNGALYYTLNGGVTWVSLESYFNTNFGLPLIGAGQTGWSNAASDNNHLICADRVAATTFYAYNQVNKKVYRSTDGGQTWAAMQGSALTLTGNYSHMKAVPQLGSSTNTTGHLFYSGWDAASGSPPYNRPINQPFYRSTDGGATFAAVANLKEVLGFGFGKNNQSSTYPAIGVYGWYNGVGGFWVSKDNGSTFTQFGPLSLYGTSDLVVDVAGNPDVADTWYVGLHNSGSAYYGA